MSARTHISAWLAPLLLAGMLSGAQAEAPASTLEHIAQTGAIQIGYGDSVSPFSYLDTDGNPIGYSIDLCTRVAQLLQQQLALPTLSINYVQRTASNRVALLANGDIDIECVASTNTAERRRSVAFSLPHFLTAVQFVALRDGGPRTIADLTGRSVASTLGTTVIGEINAINRAQKLNIAVVPTPDHRTAFDMMATGRVAAFAMDGILLSSMIANASDPSLYVLSANGFGPPQPYGLMMRRDDEPFVEAVNAALARIFSDGEIGALYEKWFTMPIPPRGINLNLPMSEELRAAFAAPKPVGD